MPTLAQLSATLTELTSKWLPDNKEEALAENTASSKLMKCMYDISRDAVVVFVCFQVFLFFFIYFVLF